MILIRLNDALRTHTSTTPKTDFQSLVETKNPTVEATLRQKKLRLPVSVISVRPPRD